MHFFSDKYLERKYSDDFFVWIYVISAVIRRIFDCFKIPRGSIFYIEYEVIPFFPPFLEKILQLKGCRLFFDYDDAIISRYDNLRNPVLKFLLEKKMACLFDIASEVVCGNDFLKTLALDKGASSVCVIPTTVDTDRYLPPFLFKNPRVVIGWIGSPTSSRYLRRLEGLLVSLNHNFGVEIRLIGAKPDIFDGVLCVSHLCWSEETEIDDIRGFDIGIMPLQNDGWAEGKCGFKLIQYMASYIPFVASPVGVNEDLAGLSDGGFIAQSDQEWFSLLSSLIMDSRLRRRMGKNGRRFVERSYDVRVAAKKLIPLLS